MISLVLFSHSNLSFLALHFYCMFHAYLLLFTSSIKSTITFLLLLATSLLNAQTYSAPESVDYDAIRGQYLISNSGNERILSRTSDGTLGIFKSEISPNPNGIVVVDSVTYA